jgi:group II intron reverse transcriptase/maturase
VSLKTSKTVLDLQLKLAGRSKSKPQLRFYSLYDKVCRKDVLWEAWLKVKRNGGSAGVDGVKVAGIKATGEGEFLRALRQELLEKRYKPQPLRRVWIPKANGKKRPLGIPAVKDRVVQQAVRLVMEPVFEAQFSESSYGFRPERGCHQAVKEVVKLLNWGLVNVVEADIVDCFGSIPHRRLMKAVSLRITDRNILKLIRQWLKCGVMEAGQFQETIAGTPQGGVISPLLANIYLDALDKLWEKRKMNSRFGQNAHLVRYADDLVILTDKSPEMAEHLLRETLGRLDLTPHPEKTRTLNAKEGHFDFLGFNFRQRKNPKTGKWFCLLQPSRKAQKKLRENIREATSPSVLARLGEVVKDRVNPIVRGWVNYFRIGNSGKVFGKIRSFVRGRVLRFIRRRQKRSGFGWNRISGDFLYGKLGLFFDYGVVRSPRPGMAR